MSGSEPQVEPMRSSPGVLAALCLYVAGVAAAVTLQPRLAVLLLAAVAGLAAAAALLREPLLALGSLVVGVTLVSKDRTLFHLGLAWTPDRVLVALLALGLVLRRIRRDEWLLDLPLLTPMVALLLGYGVGLLHSTRPAEAALQPFYNVLVGFVVLWGCADRLGTPGVRRRAVEVLFWAAVCSAAVGLAETATGRYLFQAETFHYRGGLLRAASTLGNPVPLGAYLAMTAPLGWFLVRGAEGRLHRLALTAGLVLVLGGLVATLSRQALVGLGAALVVLVAAGGAAWLLAGLGAALILAVTTSALWLDRVVSVFFDEAAVSNILHRLYMSRVAFQLIAAHPLWGVGLGSFRDLAFVVQPFGGLKSPHYGEHPVTDNTYLTLGAELGLVGLGVYLVFLGLLFRNAFRAFRAAQGLPEQRAFHLAVLAALASYTVSSVFFDAHEWLGVSAVFFFLAGVSARPGPAAGRSAGAIAPASGIH
jgi:O-antigen ligase/polysaccharide polymerase Wzy-like membrane protein